jgi:hypothetical protein
MGRITVYPHTANQTLRPLSIGCGSRERFGQADTSKRDITEEQAFFTKTQHRPAVVDEGSFHNKSTRMQRQGLARIKNCSSVHRGNEAPRLDWSMVGQTRPLATTNGIRHNGGFLGAPALTDSVSIAKMRFDTLMCKRGHKKRLQTIQRHWV